MLRGNRPHPNFDENLYLCENPDVAKMVAGVTGSTGWRRFLEHLAARTAWRSGWRHFIEHGYREYRPGVSTDVYRFVQRERGFSHTDAVAPLDLITRVHGWPDPNGFEEVGRHVAARVFEHLVRIARATDHVAVLDFGVGCGRIVRPLHALLEAEGVAGKIELFGTDIDPHAIDWCEKFLHLIGHFYVNKSSPPLPFADNQFAFLYAVSVFTHLPEEMQLEWLSELKRITRPGALLLLTSHGADLVPEEHHDAFQQSGFLYLAGPGTFGLPDFYQTSFHSVEYISRNWSRFFKIEDIVPRGVCGHQDLILCRRF